MADGAISEPRRVNGTTNLAAAPAPATPVDRVATAPSAAPAVAPGGPGDGKLPPAPRGYSTSIGLPPTAQAQPAGLPSSYDAAFASQSYVKDGSNPQMLGLMQQAATHSPELASGSFAEAVKAGKMSASDIKTLQTTLEAKGYSVGDTGVDGKFGPRTFRALQAMLSGAPPDPPGSQGVAGGAAPHGHHGGGAHGARGHHGASGTSGAAGQTDADGAASSDGAAPATGTQAPQSSGDDASREAALRANEHNRYDSKHHECFHYAWAMVQGAGGKGMGSAPSTTEGRGQPLSHLDTMAAQGKLKPGDVIYVNRRPGTDDGSHNLKNGPHWFVYMGNGKFADQYNRPPAFPRERSSAQMQQFVKGRVIDRIFHPFS